MILSKTSREYLAIIAKYEGVKFSKKVLEQCKKDTKDGYVNFVQLLKSSRKIRPL